MQKITPYLWFDNNAEEAMNFYIESFGEGKIKETQNYPEGVPGMTAGSLMGGTFELLGQELMVLNGGPLFKFTPAISFMVWAGSVENVEELWAKLVDGGEVLMELGEYPYREKYGWLKDKYGLSWQIMNGEPDHGQKIVPSLMYVGEKAGLAEDAMNFYTTLFENSSVGHITRYKPGGVEPEENVTYGEFKLAGQNFVGMDSSQEHNFTFNEAVSLYVDCKDQEEVDKYWNALTADGGEESMCGWLKDKYGVSWQIIPRALNELMGDPDPEKANRVMQAMLKMQKIEVDKLEEAHEGK